MDTATKPVVSNDNNASVQKPDSLKTPDSVQKPDSVQTPVPVEYFYVDSDPQGIQPGAACTVVLKEPNQITKSKDGKDISSGPFIEAKVLQCDATKCVVVESMNDGSTGRTLTNEGANATFMFKRGQVPPGQVPVPVVPAVGPAAVVPDAAAPEQDANAVPAVVPDAPEPEQDDANLSGGSAPNPSPPPSPTKKLEPGVSCGATLPLDDLDDSCSSNASPPPLKAYILSILNPILEEYADALFQTLRVKPYQLAESAVSDAVIAQAITPEVLQRMKALNDPDPEVQKVLADFKDNVKNAVHQSGEMLQKGVGDNIGELFGSVLRKLSSAIQLLIADLPGVGVFMAGAQLADTAVKSVEQVEVIKDEVDKALKPLNAVQAQVSAVTDAVDKATGLATDAATTLPSSPTTVKGAEGDVEMTELGPNAASEMTGLGEAASETTGLGEAKSGNVSGKGAELEMMPMGPSAASPSAASPSGEAEEESAPALGNRRTPARRVGKQDEAFATPLSKNPEEDSRLGGGGSRKRRRIHKLSRRIERTLRRVQKKYGLQSNQGDQSNQSNQSNQGKQDKNGFLRRTLRRHRKP